jgi:hypothetical protein
MSRDGALEEYGELLESHISEDLLKHTPEIKEYLLSDKCKAVFVPEVWQYQRNRRHEA